MYSSYGGYGGYSSYGNSYSSGYGGMSAYNRYGTTSFNPGRNDSQTNQNQQQENHPRKQVMAQYFQMMGGLRSMLEIGFAMVAFGRFTTKSWQILKKVVTFLAKTSQKIGQKFIAIFPHLSALTSKIGLSEKALKESSMKGKIFLAIRLLGLALFLIALKVKSQISKEVDEEHKLILEEYEEQRQERHFQKQGYF